MARQRANKEDRAVVPTADAMRRIGRAVAAYERGDRSIQGYPLRTASEDPDPVRLCKTSAAWTKGATATLDVWESGTPPSETQTTGETIEDAVNKIKDVKGNSFVIVAKAANGSWYLVEAGEPDEDDTCKTTIGGEDLTTLSGYDASKTQVLSHANGCMQWLDAEDCPTP